MPISVNRDQLWQRVNALPPHIVVIEALWDGDSNGWGVAIIGLEQTGDDVYREHAIIYIAHGLGEYHDFMRALSGQAPPYEEGLVARGVGQEVADKLGVPFYFPSPEKPAGDELPRWVDWKAGRVTSIPIRLIDIDAVIERFKSSKVVAIEVHWGYYYTFFPKLAVITLSTSEADKKQYSVHEIGGLYWDDQDQGRFIRRRRIPAFTPVEEATRIGKLLTEAFGATFYFPSPDAPRHRLPRWLSLQEISNKHEEGS